MNRTNRIELIHIIGGGAVMSELIDIISNKDKLLDFMDRYHLIGLREATEEQLKEYIEEVLQWMGLWMR